ncbi:hypothetical protein CT0861_02006 [Colletotrichum tofieldiae]|uniref:Uncharacterized protein n=1 Tax=Colletotrichum tofieldiae TaxID=708197 RepID=A0A166PTC8_9PEZI|nr:hypothetical protein CT0861_02006 [Colletotrichum tofieldiae]
MQSPQPAYLRPPHQDDNTPTPEYHLEHRGSYPQRSTNTPGGSRGPPGDRRRRLPPELSRSPDRHRIFQRRPRDRRNLLLSLFYTAVLIAIFSRLGIAMWSKTAVCGLFDAWWLRWVASPALRCGF